MKNRNLKDKRGISLIVLVITIIIMIILAAAVILSIDNSNIIEKANDSKEATNEATQREALELAVQTALMNGNGKIDTKSDENVEGSLANEIKKSFGAEAKYLGNGLVQVGENYYDIGEAGGTVEVNNGLTLAEQITANNYGDMINYSIGISGTTVVDKWRIFYKDANGVFIITKSYLPNSYLPANGVKMGTSGTYNTYWSTTNLSAYSTGSAAIDTQVAGLFKLGWVNTYPTSTIRNIKAVAALMDTTKWNGLLTEELESRGGMAIGSPTLEMWIDSWNGKYGQIDGNLYYGIASGGYLIGTSSNASSSGLYKETMEVKKGYQVEEENNLYFPHKSTYNSCIRYWLASPHSWSGMMMCVKYDGWFSAWGSNAFDVGDTFFAAGVRPVIYIPSDIKGVRQQNGTWSILY